MPEGRIPFGLRDGVPVDVSEVQSGLACSCVCPSCKRPLQAKKGKIRAHHFSHDPSSESGSCESALETSVHLMAKEVLKEDGYFVTPRLVVKRSGQDLLGKSYEKEVDIEESTRRCFDRVELETRIDEIRPDIVAYTDQGPMIIEVAVTSFARGEKKQKIRKLGLMAVEIDLGSVGYATSKDDLRQLIHSETTKTKWLSNPNAIKPKKNLVEALRAEIDRANEVIREKGRQSEIKGWFESVYQGSLSLDRPQVKAVKGGDQKRWFRCESCNGIFPMPISAVPDDAPSVECYFCSRPVSTHLCQIRR